MSHKYSKNILWYIFWIISFASLSSLCFTIFNIVKHNDDNDAFIIHSHYKPDYYIEKFTYINFTNTNKSNYSLIGTKMLHYPIVNLLEIKSPIITATSQTHTLITLSSNCAIIEKNYTKIHMFGNVHGSQKSILTNKTIYFKTEYLLFLGNQIAKTDQPIEITIGTLIFTSDGMIINNVTQELQLLNNVRGKYYY